MKKILNWLKSGWHRVGASIALTVLVLFLISCAPVKAYESHLPMQVIDWSQNNVMRVHYDDTDSYGSGWWIDNETFVTACHVVGIELLSYDREEIDGEETGRMVETEVEQVATEVQVSNNDLSTVLNLKVESCNFDTDIAVLKRQWLPSDSAFTALPSYSADSFYGESLYCAGYGLMMNMHITVGHWMGEDLRYKEGHNLATCPTIFGDSGSPALVLRNGQVQWVGMRQMVASANGDFVEHLTLISTIQTIQEELTR